MGGCNMGVDSARSVVSPEFRVHGTRAVFAADSSIFSDGSWHQSIVYDHGTFANGGRRDCCRGGCMTQPVGHSRYLGRWSLAGLARLGDVMIPGDGELPAFTASGALAHVDTVLENLEASDRDGLHALFAVFAPACRASCCARCWPRLTVPAPGRELPDRYRA